MASEAGDYEMYDGPGPVAREDVAEPDEAMVRSEEELHVTTERRAVERVRLRKHVVTEYVEQTVAVRREELRLEREAITGQNASARTGTPSSPTRRTRSSSTRRRS